VDKLVPIALAAKALGVSASTLRRWEAEGKLIPERTSGGQRRYRIDEVGRKRGPRGQRVTIAYARVAFCAWGEAFLP
jgi:excisionase family DNA binding protein